MTKIIDRAGKGAALTQSEFDANYSSLAGVNVPVTASAYTVDINNQNDVIEFNNATGVTVTLTDIATINSGLHTDDFKVTLKNIGAGDVTVNCGGTDTFETGATSIILTRYSGVTIQTDSTGTKWNFVGEKIGNNPVINTPVLNGSTLNASGAELDVLDGVTAGTAAQDKAIVLDASKDVSGINSLSASIVDAATLKIDGLNARALVGYQQTSITTTYSSTTTLSPSLVPTTTNTAAAMTFTYTPVHTQSIIFIDFVIPGYAINGASVWVFESVLTKAGTIFSGYGFAQGSFVVVNSSTTARSFVIRYAQIASGSTVYINSAGTLGTYGSNLNAKMIFKEYAL